MCSRSTKKDDKSHRDCATCHQPSDGSDNTIQSSIELANVDSELQKSDGGRDAPQKIIVREKILKVADKDVEAGERVRNVSETYSRDFCEKPRREDSEELRRKAFKMYKKYLEQKKEEDRCPPYIYVCPQRHKECAYGQESTCYDSTFNIFLVIVFMILSVMLACTTGFIYVVLHTDWLKDFFHEYSLYIAIPSLIVMMVMNYTMTCSDCAKVLPCNFIYLLLAVACISTLATVASVLLDTSIILLIYAATASVVFFFTLLAYTHFDFTKWILYVIAIFLTLCAVLLLATLSKKYLHVRYGPIQFFALIVCAVMNVLILVIELQLILGGRSMDLDESDYAIGAFLLYTAIIELCLSLVQATGILEDNDVC